MKTHTLIKIIFITLTLGLLGGCASHFTKPKLPISANKQQITLTFQVRKGVSYGLLASPIEGEALPDPQAWNKKENWIPVKCSVVISQKHHEIQHENIRLLKPMGLPGRPDWLVSVFEAQVSGEVNIVIRGDLSFLNKGREWKLHHTIFK